MFYSNISTTYQTIGRPILPCSYFWTFAQCVQLSPSRTITAIKLGQCSCHCLFFKLAFLYFIDQCEPLRSPSSAPTHSGSKWPKPTENKFTWCDFTNFYLDSKFQQIDLISVSGHRVPFIFKIGQTDASLSKIS